MADITLQNGDKIESTNLHTFNLSSMHEEDLNRIAKKCIFFMRTGNEKEADTAKAMVQQISDEKNFRASKNANDISLRNLESAKLNNEKSGQWSIIAVGAVILVGVLQAMATVYSSSQTAVAVKCESPAQATGIKK